VNRETSWSSRQQEGKKAATSSMDATPIKLLVDKHLFARNSRVAARAIAICAISQHLGVAKIL
jgi:hypothetical protein